MTTITSPRTSSPAPSSTGTPRITSPSPSSSARGSLDLSRPPQPGANPANPSQRRNRAALRDFYNLKSKPQNASNPATGSLQRTASITSTHSDASIATTTTNATLVNEAATTSALTAQLDSPDFKADEWIKTLLETSSLREILKTEATLVSEIRNLDGERKALVYDNYSKLIKAVATIGEMQRSINGPATTDAMKVMSVQVLGGDVGVKGGLEGVEELESKMESLRATVRELASGQHGDQKAKDEKKRRRDERDAQKKRKEIVKWVLDAPERLKALVDEGKKNEAEKTWTTVKKYLDRWKNVKGISEVRRACEEVYGDRLDER
ncbi:hypothetical protein H2198_005384 [Neophaeococcomyces mojaviensis]|uniref:Uncharacterized protein n=1 Tax=Neophaeococcomyces mojaviensis TaxID=3383035 RepID=A0ACC3A613_9EURO|nr:hypothetical protein H2198_005384 [Knufia sp. JES_112]